METLAAISLVLSALSAGMFFLNLLLFRRAPQAQKAAHPRISVLIPARNEEASITRAVESALASTDAEVEVVVLDDDSDDATAAEVQRIAVRDPRVRLASAPPLPPGWCGKQHACHVLSGLASHDLLCFIDADVRLSPDALARMAQFVEDTDSDLISGFPQQETVTFLERLLIPQIHFVLLCYLPMIFMRLTSIPGFAAGCGQLMMTRRDAYRRSGGHSAIRSTLHDGIRLPRAFRTAGFRTDVFNATDVATCRMYRSAHEVWVGLSKNAVEGMAAPGRLPIFTALLFGGHVLPFVLLAPALSTGSAAGSAMAAVALSWLVRAVAAFRFGQPADSAILHPAGVLTLLAVQWYALIRHLRRLPSSWKGRAYAAGATKT